jgi:hypothetical protein
MSGAQAILGIVKSGNDGGNSWTSSVTLYCDPDRGVTPEDKFFAMPGSNLGAPRVTYEVFMSTVSETDRPYLVKCVDASFEKAKKIEMKKRLTGIRYYTAHFLHKLLAQVESASV